MDEDLAAEIDSLIEEGVVGSRYDAVRQGLRRVDDLRRRRIAEEIIRGYERDPQAEREISWVDEASRSMINEESW